MKNHLEIRRPLFSRMLKAEVAEFAKSAIGIVQYQDSEELLIAPVFEPLENLASEIELLKVRYGVDPQRAKLETLKQKLMLSISSLKLQVRLISKSTNDEGIHVINSFINTYLRHLNAVKNNDKVIVQRVDGFVDSVAEDAPLAEAIEEHNLLTFVTGIKLALSEFRYTVSKRNATLASRPKLNTAQTIAKVSEATEILFKGIEVAQLINPEVDYKPLASELNELVNGFRLSASLRTAYNRRKADEKEKEMEEAENGAEEGNPSENGTTNMQTTSFKPSGGFIPYRIDIASESDEQDESWDDWDESFDEESEDGEEYAETGVEEAVEGGEEYQ